MNTIHMQCIFTKNGEKRVAGDIWFRPNDGVELLFSAGDDIPRGPITLAISPSDCADIVNFFAEDDMYFWKVHVLEPESPHQDVMCVVSFSKDSNGIAIHLSLDFETKKMHIETLIDEDTLKDMPSVWGADLE